MPELHDNLLIEEYSALRNEVLQKMDKYYNILGLGVGGISILFGLAYEKEIDAFFLVLPLVILSNILILQAEKRAVENVGSYIKFVEEIVFDKFPFGWEKWLSQDEERVKMYKHTHWAALSMLFILYALSMGGLWIKFPIILNFFIIKLTFIFVYAFLGIGILFFCLKEDIKTYLQILRKSH
jgi:hypothetical protein